VGETDAVRIPVWLRGADGQVETLGTAEVTVTGSSRQVGDFRDLDGRMLHLPAGAQIEFSTEDAYQTIV
jgi:hypothetical protein